MEIGKLPNSLLESLVFRPLSHESKKEVLIGPGVGEDACAIDCGGGQAAVFTSDPITGAVSRIGVLAVLVSCNDLAATGVRPLGLLTTILVPPTTEQRELKELLQSLRESADSLAVSILGGHTEVSDAVTRPVVVATAVGLIPQSGLVRSSGAKEGDDLVLSKSAGLEGAAILATEREEELTEALGRPLVESAQKFWLHLSVVKEAMAARDFGVNAMHDVTEGGVLGGVWEMAEASGVGVSLQREAVPLSPEVAAISRFYEIDPLSLISSGALLMATSRGEALVSALQEKGVKAAVIGKLGGKKREIWEGSASQALLEPGPDPLYRVLA